MIKINVLSPGFTSPNSAAFLMPFIMFKRALKDAGYQIQIFDIYSSNLTECDYLFIESKFHQNDWIPRTDQTLEHLADLNGRTKIIWCDQGDSSGTFLGNVVPHVTAYLKAQLLTNRRQYLRAPYGSRIYADHYHHKYGVVDNDPYIQLPIEDEKDLDKLGLSWNSGLFHHGLIGPYLLRLREKIPVNAMLHYSKQICAADRHRSKELSSRMGISYARATMRFQRERIRDILKDQLPTNKVSRRQYLRELCESKVCISPFGLGEITLKDFECFLTGSLLFKPDMSHMDTWPNFYEEGATYISHDWDLENFEENLKHILRNDANRIAIAYEGQQRFLRHTTETQAAELFVQHFQNALSRF
ncbi:MAG: glycosyltransferase [Micavibrio sp.]|nr:glycosyltransferase [Micavibrio sp.]